ncbi:hypothetical protein ACVGVM_06485 [Pseudonocardia bannensis]|uniref:Protein phosphatase 2C-like protein n=1 Tax=Pseudonocardia bannensis TaxID=630973 RepID=A0A848DKY7_9PSEU|nr:hypothetical protein [Pseudonocardia bannensis]NMH93186.1 hypothetical protein [Pseudonocardia bannensis]
MQVASAQLPGVDESADRIFVTDNAVIVLDGASAFEPVELDPGTYAQGIGESIAAQLTDDPAADLPAIVAGGIAAVTERHDLRAEHSPSSTVSILRVGPHEVDLYVLGDSPVHYGNDTEGWGLTDDRLAMLPLPEREAYRARLRAGHGFDDEHRRLLRDLQVRERRYRNMESGYWIAETKPDAACHGILKRIPREQIEWAVLSTDGASEPLAHLGAEDWISISSYDGRQLHSLLARLQSWEDQHDPEAQQYPRAKRHDDKTLVSISLHP